MATGAVETGGAKAVVVGYAENMGKIWGISGKYVRKKNWDMLVGYVGEDFVVNV